MQHRARILFLAITLGASSFSVAQLTPFSTPLTSGSQQVGQASITGVVAGADGNPLHDIRIEVHSVTTGALVQTCYTSMNGNFEVMSLRPGMYELVAVDGVNETRERVTLEGTPITMNLRLQEHSAAPKKGTVSVVELRTPEKARHLTTKAQNELLKGHPEEAQRALKEALTIAPDYPNALTLRALMKISANQPEGAMDDLDLAIKTDPSYGRAYLVLGAVYNQMGRSDDALRSLDRAAMYDSQSWQCALEQAKAWMGKHDYQHALEQLSRAQTLGGERIAGSVHLLRGYALMGQKHLEQAANELEAYLTADPNSQLAGSVRMALAKIKSSLAQEPQSVPLTAVTGLFAPAH